MILLGGVKTSSTTPYFYRWCGTAFPAKRLVKGM
jgi:hypothetical protein